MEYFPLLDVVIGLALIYTGLSLLASELTEWTITVLRRKNKYLVQCITTLLGETLSSNDSERFKDTITSKILTSSYIVSVTQLSRQRSRSMMISNITPQLFAEALLEILQSLSRPPESSIQYQPAASPMMMLQVTVEYSPNLSALLRANLTRLIQRVQALEPDPSRQMGRLKQEIARWFSHSLAEATGRYRHDYKLVSFLVSLVLTIFANVDSLYIIRRISENTAIRAITMQNVTQIQGCQNSLNSAPCKDRLSVLMESTTIPLGWQPSNRNKQFPELSRVILLRTIGGWLLTSMAVSMGSRFWLQLLRRFSAFLCKENPSRRSDSIAHDSRFGDFYLGSQLSEPQEQQSVNSN